MILQSSFSSLEESIASISARVTKEKEMLDHVVEHYKHTPTYIVPREDGKVKDYHYFLYPFKGMTLVGSELYAHLGKFLARMIPTETEVIVSIEADGIGIAHFVGAYTELPVIISKHFHYNVPHIQLVQQAGYHTRDMYLPKIIQGKKVAIVDCMVSTGGTVKSLVDAITSLEETNITGVFCVNDKNNYGTREQTVCGYPYKYLIDASVDDAGIVHASWSLDLKMTFWEMLDDEFYAITKHCSSFSNMSKRGYQVGSIILDAESFEILAWGFRRGNVHAEQDAIAMLKSNCPDWKNRRLTLYSTMEPCTYRNDKGQTPCAHLVSELPNCYWVIIGMKDIADERIYGEGIKQLLAAGKNVRLIETGETFRAETSSPGQHR
ncbi:MAG: hypothetical protein GW939_01155 [Candidatus Magasanikbacteria bacterium]|nr:hypothetical protein [Candidatus Magasanikbacteria bacterium]NCS72192.1 hypothetical protein [Candidatus Magasanikbacteria bacterium]